MKKVLFLFEKDVAKYLNVILNVSQRVLPTPHIYYTHLTSAMFEHSNVSSWIKDTCIRKFHSQREVVAGLFLSMFPVFRNF